MPEYKLVYFNGKGRAELARWIFAYGGIPYTDERIERDDWPEKKKSIEGGRLPVLIVDGHTLPQSLAIARFLAKKAGLVPEDDFRAAACDALADTISDLMREAHKVMVAEKTGESKEAKKEFYKNHLEPVMTLLNKRFGEKEWFTSDKITWADLTIAIFFGGIRKMHSETLEKFPALLAHVNKVEGLPKIKEWIAARPDTQF
ncbi:hypothetical protein OTU49_006362 [Cherax quadricarinatus]|uniref:glutathione transferase n=1 Tax=Cherax quadricarinatus TaxID=27406 RepID=A0AAW0WPM2_CHEQU|nr:hematopoietic prostaglandin D synthase-like isoform X2 [Cherax quadricarinatus]